MDIKSAKIYIVEDEPQINRLIELVLQSEGFYNVKKFYDGDNALIEIKNEKPDLILLDVMIPGIDGFELCKKVKSDENLKNVPVIMLTAKKSEEDILTGFETGAVDYVSKPFSNKILLARIKAQLNSSYKKSSKLQYKEIIIDDDKKIVKLKENIVDLTNFEYKILKIFVENKGIVFSRSKLLSVLRGDDGFNVSERAMDVQILNLRRKLGEYGQDIETIRGEGYKLRESVN